MGNSSTHKKEKLIFAKNISMKYHLLSKEQFEELHEEFATYLASNGIDKKLWDNIKEKNQKKAMTHLENFSDIVWDKVLDKTQYLEHYSKDSMNLFHCLEDKVIRIVVRIDKEGIDLSKKADFEWFINNSSHESIEYFKGEKAYKDSRNQDIYQLILQGSVLSDGKLFTAISEMLNPIGR